MNFSERLTVPLWWWPVGLAIGGIGAAEVHGGASGVLRSVVPYVVLPSLVLVGLALSGRPRVRVLDGVLHVPGARAPVTAFGRLETLDHDGVRRWLGPLAQPHAFVAVRAWVPTAVRVAIDDPGDDTPYWVVSTRRPAALVAAVEATRSAGP